MTDCPIKYEDGQWHLSYSQSNTFNTCARRWRFEKVEGLLTPWAVHFDVGTCFHAAMEDMIAGKEPFGPEHDWLYLTGEEQHMVRQMIQKAAQEGLHLAPSDDPFEIEAEFYVKITDRCWAKGFVDWCSVEGGWILDHKTSSNLAYAPSSEELSKDVQLNVYAIWLNQERVRRGLEPLEEIDVGHNENQKPNAAKRKGMKAYRRWGVSTKQTRIDTWHYLRNVSLGMEEVKKVEDFRELGVPTAKLHYGKHKGKNAACYAYASQCPFYGRCFEGETADEHNARVQSSRDEAAKRTDVF